MGFSVFERRHSWALEEIWVLSAEEDPVGDNGSPQRMDVKPHLILCVVWVQISILRTSMAGEPRESNPYLLLNDLSLYCLTPTCSLMTCLCTV
ncbi:unnamed protein product [Boreogadus saida]